MTMTVEISEIMKNKKQNFEINKGLLHYCGRTSQLECINEQETICI